MPPIPPGIPKIGCLPPRGAAGWEFPCPCKEMCFPHGSSQGGEGGDVPAPVSWDGLLQPRSQWEVPHHGGAAALPDSVPAPSTSLFLFIPLISLPLKMHCWGLGEDDPFGGNGLPQHTPM